MNYKIKWWLYLLIFPLVSLFPLIIFMIINSFGDAGVSLLPNLDNIGPAIFLTYIPIFFFIQVLIFENENRWRSLRWQPAIILIIIGFCQAFITGIIYGIVSNYNKESSFFWLVVYVSLLEILGVIIHHYSFRWSNVFVSYSGPLNRNIYNIASSYIVTYTFKKWNLYFNSVIEIDDNHYDQYSILFTNKAIYILDELKEEDNLKVYFEHEIFEKFEEEIDFDSLLVSDNFNFSVVRNKETDDIFDLKLNKEVVDQIPKKVPSEKNQVESKIIVEPSVYIENIISKRKSFIHFLNSNALYGNLDKDEVEKLPIINVVILPKEYEVIGSNEDFIVTNVADFFTKVKKIEKLLAINVNVKKTKKVFKRKRV